MENFCDMRVFGERFFNGKVEITDPCYDKNVWCRLTADVEPGNYDLLYLEKDEGGWGVRVSEIAILNKDIEMDSFDVDNLIQFYVGDIGVDAGLAGFFENKPDYDNAAWSEFCNNLHLDNDNNVWKIDCGFFSESGYGDGCYPVYGYKTDDGKVVALSIIFIDECDDEDDYFDEEDDEEESYEDNEDWD